MIARPLASTLLVLLAAVSIEAKVETWRQDGVSTFLKGRREGVVLSDQGRIRLARSIRESAKLEASRVWDLAQTADGIVFAATGNDGKVFRREGRGVWTVAYDSADSQALSLAVTSDGKTFVGTGPGGFLVDVNDPNHPSSRPDSKVQYIWDLANDSRGNLYAATGPTGQLWKRAADGAWSLLLDSKHAHLLCVAIGPDGSIYAGSDGEGLLYRVGPDGKVSVVYDAPQNEIRALHVSTDGSIYAGTAAESGGTGGSGRTSSLFSTASNRVLPMSPELLDASTGRRLQTSSRDEVVATSTNQGQTGGTAAPKPPGSGENSVYRIGPDGVAREVFRHKTMIYALACRDDRLYVGTGPDGFLFEVRDLGRESSPVARLDHGQVLALLAGPKDGLLIGAGDPGAILALEPGHCPSGTLTSEVLDARLISKFGSLSWKAETPAGTSVSIRVRTGNVGEPDETWSAWTPERRDSDSPSSPVPPGRFAQYQARLESTNHNVTPELRSVAIRYQTVNLPPEIARIDIPDVGFADGATRQARLALKWEATDPNGDDLTYSLHFRKEEWPDWVKLGDQSLTDPSFSWDTSAIPEGTYRLRLTASDRPSNGPSDTLVRDRVSEPFLVDHRSPNVSIVARGSGDLAVLIKDDLTRIVKASYALDGGEWVAIFPDDGLFDTPNESFALSLPDLKSGTHLVMVRATDAAGNVGTGDLVIPGH